MGKPKILVVDDEPINLRLVAQVLQNRYDVMVARSGAMVFQLLQKVVPDLILLDINLPEMDGFEISKQLKKNPRYAQIPFIFLTADGSHHTITEAFRLGAVDYITKPFQNEELNMRVDNHLRTYALQKRLHKSHQQSLHFLKIIDEYVSFVKVDKEGIIQHISRNFCQQLQCAKDDLLGRNINILKSGNTPNVMYAQLWETIVAEKTFVFEIEDRNFGGGSNWYRVNVSADYDENNEFVGYIAFYQNIDDQIRFKVHAETDALTKLPNRGKLDELLMAQTQRALHSEYDLSIILVDIDHFKEVNDTYGHQVGDTILQEFATILTQNIRRTDFLGRWGGEEFLIITPYTDGAGAVALAEKLRRAIEQYPFSVVGHKSASLGVAQYRQDETCDGFFRRVDKALYVAKESGRNRLHLYGQTKEVG